MNLRRLIPPPAAAVAWKGLFLAATGVTRIGERLGIDWLIYNPLLFLWFHLSGVIVAPTIFAGLRAAFPDARRWLDVGAGTGTIAAEGRRCGHEVLACERSPVARWFARRQGVPVAEFDLERERPACVGSGFDVAYCFEVGEHLPPRLSGRLAAFVASSAPTIVFTAARPGQGGHGHINEQPPAYWIETFAAAGCRYDESLSESLRERFRTEPVHVDYLINNLLVFRAQGPEGP